MNNVSVEKQKQQAVERGNEIKQQCEAVCRVFEAATKQKAWDHFTKAQRKNITHWHGAIKNEIKSAKEAEIENRVEVGMDLDDEVPTLGGLIEKPALQTSEEGENQQDQEEDQTSLSTTKAKKRRVEASESDADAADSLRLENGKLRTQVESLKAIAEQNTSLMWSMQSYQYQAEEIRQQYNNMIAAKDYEIFSLKKALQDANILNDPKIKAMAEFEILVDLGKDSHNVTDMDLDTEELTDDNENGNENSKLGMQDEIAVKEGDIGYPVESENVDTETEEKGIKEEVKDEKLDEGKVADDKKSHQAEEDINTEEKAKLFVEDEKSHKEDAEKQTSQEEKENEKMKEVEDDNVEEEGSGRFVKIDDEQFEVIDDMDEEDSDDDYKEVTAAGSSLQVFDNSAQKVQENEKAEYMNSDRANEQLASDSTNYAELDSSTQGKTQQSEDDYKEVKAQQQVTTDSSNYQLNYDSQYQAWLSAAVNSRASMNYGPNQVRISGEELVLVGIICSYLQLCPAGATSGEIRDYLSRQFKERRRDVVDRLLCSLPVLFKAEDASGNAKWKFCGLEKLAEAKG
ncbi:unnamed protein product [Porites lobata]|uniref:GRIP domain-containing protein n=1 Tax=Porites lobata TaxID=104759 RepID=A0ABN8S372_9CNID|nr:unnamed protein product [Porites lobata]